MFPTQTANQPSFGSTNSIVPGGKTVDPFNPGGAPKQAVIVTSAPARAVTADNTAKLTQIMQPAPITSTTGTTSTTGQTTATPTKTATPTADPATTPTTPKPTATDYDSAVSSIKDPGMAAQFKSTLQNFDNEATNAQSNIDAIKARSLNDPAALAMVNAIKVKYEAQRKILGARNTQLLGRYSTGNAAFGGLGQMNLSFLNNEQAKADERMNALQTQEDEAIMKAQVAYQTQNFKDLNTAMEQYDKANKGKLDALSKLLTETNKAVTAGQAQEKLEMAQEKQAVTLDVTKSANLGNALAKAILDSGITDKAQIDAYVEEIGRAHV